MKFEAGNTFSSGRPKGVRNRLSGAFLRDLLAEWTSSGQSALRIMVRESPTEFCRLVAGILPKELEVSTHNAISELSDDEIDEMIQRLRSEIEAAPMAKVQ